MTTFPVSPPNPFALAFLTAGLSKPASSSDGKSIPLFQSQQLIRLHCLAVQHPFQFLRCRFCISGNTCEYTSKVKVMLAWPRRSLTTFGFLPACNNSVAQVCRKLYRRIDSSNPACRKAVLKWRCVRFYSFSGAPKSEQNTRS